MSHLVRRIRQSVRSYVGADHATGTALGEGDDAADRPLHVARRARLPSGEPLI